MIIIISSLKIICLARSVYIYLYLAQIGLFERKGGLVYLAAIYIKLKDYPEDSNERTESSKRMLY
jgi:hypothetical protein